MALFYPRYSTWKGPTFHLEDLIVTQKERGIGVGKALYTAFIEYAVSEGVGVLSGQYWIGIPTQLNFMKIVVLMYLMIGAPYKWMKRPCVVI